ncbi:MAG: hypothetical protein JW976_05045 [Syntrophaceae bacterium]|nr:hypothetical protein [Syntrophaceae bacterium]
MESDLLEKIDNYRFENRINSRSEAIRLLIESALRWTKPDKKEQQSISEKTLPKGVKESNPFRGIFQNLRNKPAMEKWTSRGFENMDNKASATLEPKEPKNKS